MLLAIDFEDDERLLVARSRAALDDEAFEDCLDDVNELV